MEREERDDVDPIREEAPAIELETIEVSLVSSSTAADAVVSDEVPLVSDQEFFPDCGCGLVGSCVTEDAILYDTEFPDENEAAGAESLEEEQDDSEEDVSSVEKSSEEVNQTKPESTENKQLDQVEEVSGSEDEPVPVLEELSDAESLFFTTLGVPRFNGGADEEEAEDVVGSNDDDYDEKKDATCFVATAAFQKVDHPDVAYLRQFRDCVLSTSSVGQRFIKVYWLIGPWLAKPVAKFSVLAFFSRVILSALVRLLKKYYFFHAER